MLRKEDLERVIFFDIETVPNFKNLEELRENNKYEHSLFMEKINIYHKDLINDYTYDEIYTMKAPIYPEFGKIVCFSYSKVKYDKDGNENIQTSSIYGDNEKEVIEKIQKFILKIEEHGYILGGHNIKNFDVPWVVRKMVQYGLQVPDSIWFFRKKPWEIELFDTKEIWAFGTYSLNARLSEITNTLGVPTPKDDIEGCEVYRVYYIENDLERIKVYCEKDTIATLRVAQKFLNKN